MVLGPKRRQGELNDHYDGKHFFWSEKPFKHHFRDLLKWRFLGKRSHWPKHIPVEPFSKPVVRVADKLSVTYIGHATLLVQAANLNILTDPQFSRRASPFKWFGPKRVQLPGFKLSDMPPIDVIFVSHNHYDHLDMRSLKYFWKRDRPLIITPLGNEKIIRQVDPKVRIQVLDWEEAVPLSERAAVQLLPSQHWSARTMLDRNRALWGAACFKLDDKTFLFMGDTGFDEALFQRLKSIMGTPPDIAALPIGSYEPRWFMSYAHMNPEEAWKAFNILQGRYMLPIHYDVFPLGDEPFGEALDRLLASAGKDRNKIRALKAGENFDLR